MSPTQSLCFEDATRLAQLVACGEVSAREVMLAHLERIHALNPRLNAICTLVPDAVALEMADEADRKRQRGDPLGPLHGLPMACKDLANTAGIRTTFGSAVLASNIPVEDQLFVQRLKAAGALVIGKTNVPEFGAGSHTFNAIFGTTCNPWDTSLSAGGSSGGAAAALAARLLPLADGSDMGGSLRNPAGFCNVIGLRPSMGRVPMWPGAMAWQSRLGVEGPMARTMDDIALLLSVMAGPDPRDPRSLTEPGDQFRDIPFIETRGLRIGSSQDLGFLPVEKPVRDLFEAGLEVFESIGCVLTHQHPKLDDAMPVFRTLRANFYAALCGPMLAEHRSSFKQTLLDNTELGFSLNAQDLAQADIQRTRIYGRMLAFFEHHDFLVLPSTQVMPFSSGQEWVTEIDGQTMADYLDWMTICCVITITDLPVISIPCGFTETGLPCGMQIVGPPWADRAVMALAKAYLECVDFTDRTPPL